MLYGRYIAFSHTGTGMLDSKYFMTLNLLWSKEEGKYQESIQSSTTPDLADHTGKWQIQENIIHIRATRSTLSQQVITRLHGTGQISVKHKSSKEAPHLCMHLCYIRHHLTILNNEKHWWFIDVNTWRYIKPRRTTCDKFSFVGTCLGYRLTK